MQPMPASDPTRDVAFALLSHVLDRHRPLEGALDALPGGIEPRDRAAGHRLAASVLRRLGTLDAVLEPYLAKAPPEPVRHILRLGAAALLLLDTPGHAGVATAVDLARAKGLTPFAGLVNAVLRKVATGGLAALENLDSPRLDTPPWLWAAWGADARAIATAHQTEAPLDVTLRPDAFLPDGGEALPGGVSFRFPAGTRPTALDGFDAGDFWVQDAAATLPARLLRPQPGERIADLCAAPGGKTAQLAAAGAHVIAVEQDSHRMTRLTDNLARLRLDVETVLADATVWRPAAALDAVLIDAPCSATGTIRRHPDVLRLKRAADLPGLVAQQDRLIAAACDMLPSGGRLVYAVCSLQPEEGAMRMQAALARLPLVNDPVEASELAELEAARTGQGWVRTTPAMWPGRGGIDGFFIARLRKR